MAEINDLNISANNNTGRWPNGMPVAQANDSARENEAMIAREFKDTTGQLATTGTSTVYAVTTYRALNAYASGICLTLRFHLACGNSPTLAMNGLAAKALCRQNGDPIVVGDIVLNQIVNLVYNSALGKFVCLGIGDSVQSNYMPYVTKANLPAANSTNLMYVVTDEAGGAVPAFSDGTNWRRVTDRAIVS